MEMKAVIKILAILLLVLPTAVEEFAKRLQAEEPMLAEVVKVSGAKPG
jgi:hypothetical protein